MGTGGLKRQKKNTAQREKVRKKKEKTARLGRHYPLKKGPRKDAKGGKKRARFGFLVARNGHKPGKKNQRRQRNPPTKKNEGGGPEKQRTKEKNSGRETDFLDTGEGKRKGGKCKKTGGSRKTGQREGNTRGQWNRGGKARSKTYQTKTCLGTPKQNTKGNFWSVRETYRVEQNPTKTNSSHLLIQQHERENNGGTNNENGKNHTREKTTNGTEKKKKNDWWCGQAHRGEEVITEGKGFVRQT